MTWRSTEKIPQIVDVRDESTDDIRVVMELKNERRASRRSWPGSSRTTDLQLRTSTST